jgi:hypothetical protein
MGLKPALLITNASYLRGYRLAGPRGAVADVVAEFYRAEVTETSREARLRTSGRNVAGVSLSRAWTIV